MNRRLFALLPALALMGCAGTVESPRFKDAKDFFEFIDGLELNRMSIVAASTRLGAEGYICKASGLETICSVSERTLMCKEKTSVTLAPRDKHQISVKEKYSELCI